MWLKQRECKGMSMGSEEERLVEAGSGRTRYPKTSGTSWKDV